MGIGNMCPGPAFASLNGAPRTSGAEGSRVVRAAVNAGRNATYILGNGRGDRFSSMKARDESLREGVESRTCPGEVVSGVVTELLKAGDVPVLDSRMG